MTEFVNISDVIDKDQKNVSSIDWADEGYDDDGGQNKWNTQNFQAQLDSVSIKDIQNEQEKDVKPWFPEAEEKPKKYVPPQRPENRRVTIPKDTPVPDRPPYTALVRNLDYKVGDSDLREHFSEYNPSNVTVSLNKETGKSRGFGYVDFQTGEDLGHALSLNGSELFGRVIEVFVKPPYQGKDNSYSGGYKSNYNFRNRNDDQNNAPRERKSLNLVPRTKPLETRHLNPSESDGVTPVHNESRNNFEPEYKKPYNNNNNRQPRSEYRESRSEHRESRQSTQNDEPPRERKSLNLAPRTKPLETRHLNPGESDGVTPLLNKQGEPKQNPPPKKQESTWGRGDTSSNRGRGSSQRGRGGRGGSTTSQPRTEQRRVEVSSDGFQTRGGKKKNQGQSRQGSHQYSINEEQKTSFESSNPYDLLDQVNN